MQPLEVVSRGAVGQVQVKSPARPRRPLGPREQVASLTQRVLEQYRQTGSIPAELRNRIAREEQAHRWGVGEPTPLHLVEKYVDEWLSDLLSADDAKRGVARPAEVR